MIYSHHNIHEALGNVVYQTRIFINQISIVDDNTTAYGNFEFSESYAENLTTAEMVDEIREELHVSCGCAHDCCGHTFGWGRALEQIGKRTFSIRAFYAKNY